MGYRKLIRHALIMVVTLTAPHVHAETTDYTLKYNTWELISVPNPIPFAISTPMKMFGEQIAAELPLAKYGLGGDWIMYSYDSAGTGVFKVAEPDTVFEPGKGYWAIQAASMDDITVQVVTRYNLGARGPGGGIVFYVDPDSGGRSGLEAAPEDQDLAQWCPNFIDVADVVNISSATAADQNSGSFNTPLIKAACGPLSAAGVASDYVWPERQTDGFLPNKEELDLLYEQSAVVGGFAIGSYWSSSEFDDRIAWLQGFLNGDRGILVKDFTLRVRAVRAF